MEKNLITSLNAPFRPLLGFRGLSFSFVVYGLGLLVKVWFVFVVLALEVPGLLRWFSSTFLGVQPYLFLCIYHWPRWPMMSDFLYNFISFRIHYSFWRDSFIPSDFAFFYTVANKHTHLLPWARSPDKYVCSKGHRYLESLILGVQRRVRVKRQHLNSQPPHTSDSVQNCTLSPTSSFQ